MPRRIRVHELSRELCMSLTEVLEVCESLGISAKTHSSSIEHAQADRIRHRAAREGPTGQEPSSKEPMTQQSAEVTSAPPQHDAETAQQQARSPTGRPRPTTRPAALPATRPVGAQSLSQGIPVPESPVTSITASDGSLPVEPPASLPPDTTAPGVALPVRSDRSGPGIIRSRYLTVCGDLVAELGTEPANHTVAKDASFGYCLGYLQNYIVAQRPHYRFDRYAALLSPWYHESAFPDDLAEHYWDRGYSRLRLLHIDLGSGPGLFTWVVRDYLDRTFWGPRWEYDSMHIGYDYNASMVDLATVIWDRLAVDSKAVWCSSQESLAALAQWPIRSCDYLLVTMGHVIIQLSEQNQTELDGFAALVCRLLDDHYAPPTDILIADAHSGSRPLQFERALERFVTALNAPRADEQHDRSTWYSMDLPLHVLPEGSRAALSNWRQQALSRRASTGHFAASEPGEENPF